MKINMVCNTFNGWKVLVNEKLSDVQQRLKRAYHDIQHVVDYNAAVENTVTFKLTDPTLGNFYENNVEDPMLLDYIKRAEEEYVKQNKQNIIKLAQDMIKEDL